MEIYSLRGVSSQTPWREARQHFERRRSPPTLIARMEALALDDFERLCGGPPLPGAREIPVFPVLRPYLEDAWELVQDAVMAMAPADRPGLRHHPLPRRQFKSADATRADYREGGAEAVAEALPEPPRNSSNSARRRVPRARCRGVAWPFDDVGTEALLASHEC
jgi:hypothetical protein